MRQVFALALFAGMSVSLAGAADVTFTKDVAPIVFQNCASCHRDGQAAPFALVSYDDVRKRGKLIEAVTAARYMPPWHAAPNYGHFADERRLTDEQIKTLAAWVKAGMPEGNASELPKFPDYPDGWQLGEPDAVVKMETPYNVPADGEDIYRNFVAAIGNKEAKWVRAVEFRPGARAVMHHSLFRADAAGMARKLDARDEEPGWGGMDSGVRGSTSVGGWAVGGNARVFAEDAPIRIKANSDFIFQSHFHPSGKPETEVSTAALYFTDQPATRTRIDFQIPPLYGRGAGINIPAGDEEFTIQEQWTTPAAIEIFSVTPHAHYIGKAFKSWAVLPDGKEVPLIHVPDWDFAWQDRYTYAEPVKLPAGSTIHAIVTYDNSAENPNNPHNPPKQVRWGLSSFDEMGSVIFSALPVDEQEAKVIKTSYRQLSAKHVQQAREQRRGQKSTIRNSSSSEE